MDIIEILVFVSFFPSSRESLNPLRYILAGGMFCLFTYVKIIHKKEGESVATLRMGMVLNIKKVCKRRFEVVKGLLIIGSTQNKNTDFLLTRRNRIW